jgi:biopolymer transport protein ExbB
VLFRSYDAPSLFEKLRALIAGGNVDEAYRICAAGGRRALPRVLGAGIKRSQTTPQLVGSAMAEESTHMAAQLQRRLGYLVMFGNASTLMGLLGTVYGLIMSFAAVGRPGIAAVEKSSLLAAGISTAMNSTLTGLTISVPCVLVYAFLRFRVDNALMEIDRYAIAIMKLLIPPEMQQKERPSTAVHRRGGGGSSHEEADTDVTPMLNLMVMLIPLLLTSSEFVKMGTIELKLPEASGGGGGGGGGGAEEQKEVKLDLGIIITTKGFTLFHYFKQEKQDATPLAERTADVPMKNGAYDFAGLNKALSEVRRKALVSIMKAYDPATPEGISLLAADKKFSKMSLSNNTFLADNDAVKIVAEEKITYQTVVSVMDAARGARTGDGRDTANVSMFPNVSIAGGIVN